MTLANAQSLYYFVKYGSEISEAIQGNDKARDEILKLQVEVKSLREEKK